MLGPFISLGSGIAASNIMRLSSPYKLTFAITYKCNSRCKTCNIWQKAPADELSTKGVIRILSAIKAPWVNLTGGEPFLRKDLYEIAAAIRPSTFMLNFITNGTILGTIKTAERIASLRFPKLILGVSIDGPKGLHDSIRGVEGSYEKAIATFKGLRKIRKIQAYIGYTISPFNLGKIPATIAALNKEGIELSEVHFNTCQESAHYFGNTGMLKQGYSEKILQDVEWVLKHKKQKGIIGLMEKIYLKHAKSYKKTGKSPLPCKALSASCFIDPEGVVYPCTQWDKPLGNLGKQNFRETWNSKKTLDALAQIKRLTCPNCWTPCEAYQAIYGNLLNPKIINPK